MIQKRNITDKGIQLTCFDPKTLRYEQGTDPILDVVGRLAIQRYVNGRFWIILTR